MAGSSVYSLKDLSYSQILKSNLELSKAVNGANFTIDIFSNITINPIKEILEFSVRSLSAKPVVKIGGYDNIIQDSFLVGETNMVIVFYELINLTENFHLQAELLSGEEVNDVVSRCKKDIDVIFNNLSAKPMVLFNTFTSYPFTGCEHSKRNLDLIEKELNHYLIEKKPNNVQLIDINRILCTVGLKEALDEKKFLKYKSLYRIEFLKSYVHAIDTLLRKNTGKLKKALIFDCDNTLWKGVIGEDGPAGIDMSPKSEAGIHYHLVQKIAAGLSEKGVLVCLCSKNNPGEVEELLRKHTDMVLRNEHVVAMKVNWSNKDENLVALAKELNIGLDSFVFIDDSEFEVNLIRTILPEVLTFAVPKDITEYPAMILEIARGYFNLEALKEDMKKVKIYKEQALRNAASSNISDIDAYLATLETKVVISKNNKEQVPRIAQLTQKTNQFNLTTRRYTETEIFNLINNPKVNIFTMDVSDKFGDSGITGVAIIEESATEKGVFVIDSYLLSCRVLGRKIESAFLNYILGYYKNSDCKAIRSKFIPTNKNNQVKNFYTDHQFEIEQDSENEITYVLNMEKYKKKNIGFITLIMEE